MVLNDAPESICSYTCYGIEKDDAIKMILGGTYLCLRQDCFFPSSYAGFTNLSTGDREMYPSILPTTENKD